MGSSQLLKRYGLLLLVGLFVFSSFGVVYALTKISVSTEQELLDVFNVVSLSEDKYVVNISSGDYELTKAIVVSPDYADFYLVLSGDKAIVALLSGAIRNENGGVLCFYLQNCENSYLAIRGLTIRDGSVSAFNVADTGKGNGGGIYIETGKCSIVSFDKVAFVSNTAKRYGGAVFMELNGKNSFFFSDCVFENNTAWNSENFPSYGGAIYFDAKESADVEILFDRCKFISNNQGKTFASTVMGSAIYANFSDCFDVDFTVRNSLFYNNCTNTGTIFIIYSPCNTSSDIADFKVINNTFVDNKFVDNGKFNQASILYGAFQEQPTVNFYFYNNIAASMDSDGSYISFIGNNMVLLDIQGNIFDGNINDLYITNGVSVISSPIEDFNMFDTKASLDAEFRPTAGSPAIDFGVYRDFVGSYDIAGKPRCFDMISYDKGNIDSGAYEYNSTFVPKIFVSADKLEGVSPLLVKFRVCVSDDEDGFCLFGDFGDGVPIEITNLTPRSIKLSQTRVYSVEHTFYEAGEYNVTFKVEDKRGVKSFYSLPIKVFDVPSSDDDNTGDDNNKGDDDNNDSEDDSDGGVDNGNDEDGNYDEGESQDIGDQPDSGDTGSDDEIDDPESGDISSGDTEITNYSDYFGGCSISNGIKCFKDYFFFLSLLFVVLKIWTKL